MTSVAFVVATTLLAPIVQELRTEHLWLTSVERVMLMLLMTAIRAETSSLTKATTILQFKSATSVGLLKTVVTCLRFPLQMKETRPTLTTMSMATKELMWHQQCQLLTTRLMEFFTTGLQL